MMSKRDRQTNSAATEQKIGPAVMEPAPIMVPEDMEVPLQDATAYRSAQDYARVLALVWRARLELVGHPAGDALRRLEETTAASAWACPLRQIAAALRLMHKDTAAGMLVDAADLLAE